MDRRNPSLSLILVAIVFTASACSDGAFEQPATADGAGGSGAGMTTASGGSAQGGSAAGGSGGTGGALPDCGASTTVTPNAYYVDVDNLSGNADDANDGKLTTEGGTGPWRTWSKFAAELDSNRFVLGDWIYLRGGTYVPTATVWVTGGGTTTNSQKITISGYPGETATIDHSVTGDVNLTAPLSGDGPIHHNGGNVRWQNLHLISDGQGWSAGNATDAPGVQFSCIKQTWSGTPTGPENFGVFSFHHANDFLIEGCDIEGSAGLNSNAGTVYLIYMSRGLIRNNVLRQTDSGQVIHVKKNGVVAAPGDLVVENNLIIKYGDPNSGTFAGGNGRFLIRNNIFAFEHDHAPWFLPGDSGGNMSPIGKENIVEHNTFYSGASSGFFGINRQGSGTHPTAGEGNTLTDNVFMGTPIIFRYDSGPHDTTLDYNLYKPGGNAVEEYYVSYDLAGWQAQYGQDANSIEGVPIFATTPNLEDPSSFALDPSSPGYQAASDGKDMGADVTLVGPRGM